MGLQPSFTLSSPPGERQLFSGLNLPIGLPPVEDALPRRCLEVFHCDQAPKSPTEALRDLKALFDDGLITEEEYEQKRKKYLSHL